MLLLVLLVFSAYPREYHRRARRLINRSGQQLMKEHRRGGPSCLADPLSVAALLEVRILGLKQYFPNLNNLKN